LCEKKSFWGTKKTILTLTEKCKERTGGGDAGSAGAPRGGTKHEQEKKTCPGQGTGRKPIKIEKALGFKNAGRLPRRLKKG